MIGQRLTVAACLLALLYLPAACSPGARPGELVKADRLMQDKLAANQAARAAPQVFKYAQKYYNLAEEAFEDGDMDQCLHLATMAAIKFSTAAEHAKRLAAEDRQAKAEQRADAAGKVKQEQQGRLGDFHKRIARMEKILALQKNVKAQKQARQKAREALEAEKQAAAERLAAEQAKAEELKKAQKIQETIASAASKIQAAESLEAKKHDPVNLNSSKTFLDQARKALGEQRFQDATDLAKMAMDKATAATNKAQAEYAKKTKETEILKERESLFKEANSIEGMQVKQEQRGVVLTLHEMFGSRKAIVLPERTYMLDKIAQLAKKYPDYPIVVEGYTDSRGRDADNLALSQSRAQSVLDYLIQQQQLKFERLKSSGYGEANPVADNSSAEGRGKNRRVEVIFLFR